MTTSSNFILSLSLLLLGSNLANAQYYSDDSGYEYGADARSTANLAFYSLFTIGFFLANFLGIISITVSQGHRLPFIIMYFANGCAFVQCAVVALQGLISFFSLWALPLLFLAFYLLISDRLTNANIVSGGSVPKHNVSVKVAIWGYFAFLMVMATAASAVFVDYMRFLFFPTDFTSAELFKKVDTSNNMMYSFNAFFIFTAVILGTLSVRAYTSIRRANLDDKIIKLLTFVALPVYTVFMLLTLIFTIVFSPSGIKIQDNILPYENASLANTILTQGFFLVVSVILTVLGMKPRNWLIHNGVTSFDPARNWRQPQEQLMQQQQQQMVAQQYNLAQLSSYEPEKRTF
ncbi:hypothetical protein PNOK_0951300 [Pyrrhoderma noxium]|uniref:Uncharacterized protein n=1 Tax=Pyrrhoderma noxium TaxID=2282107 RepID=A0A286U5W9_9AGAM|nr:hypothetical protein PNOK_0951300 [Pyrrhoderma noxium]